MACACKVNQEINRIHKYYSYHGKDADEGRNRMSINKKDAAIAALAYILTIPLLPLMFLFTLFYSIFSKNRFISMRKFLGFIHRVRNGRQEQII
jgi:hypothetical protein